MSFVLNTPACVQEEIELDGVIVKEGKNNCPNDGNGGSSSFFTGESSSDCCKDYQANKKYSFKTIPSFIMHKSPTDEEYGKELTNLMTPSLPSDRDRYIDFLDKYDTYAKIVYPNFFRISLTNDELNYSGALSKIKQLLDFKTAEIRLL
jgi:hypothetical protein